MAKLSGLIRSVFLFTFVVALGHGGQHWISISTSHFEMYTNNSEKQAEQALQGFEQVRYFFLQNSRGKQGPDGRVRIIAFSSEREFKPYRPNAGVFAYYQPSHERDYIVMQDINPEHRNAAVHEYTHLILRHLKLELPLWLEEGMAEFYSSLEPMGQQAMVGRPLADHIMEMGSHTPMDWRTLLNVGHDSPYYTQPDKMRTFYSQSWALTHMLEMSNGYRPGFSKFFGVVSTGTPAAEALEKVYGKNIAEVGKDAEAYVHQSTMKAALFNVKLGKSELDPDIAQLSPFQSELALADLLSTRPQTAAEAQQRLLALERQDPASVELQESLGYLAWQQNNTQEAMKHFGVAVEHGSRNANMILHYGQLLQSKNAPADEVIKVVQQSLAIQPDNLDARLFLAEVQLANNRYGSALAAVASIHTVKPDQAFRYFAVNAAARAQLKDYAGGKADALQALKYSESSSERMQMTSLLEFIEQATNRKALNAVVEQKPPPVDTHESESALSEKRPTLLRTVGLPRVQGKTKSFECAGQGTYRLHVQDGDHEWIFAMPDPKDIIVRNTDSGTIEWSCGLLKPQSITVVYKPEPQGKTAGIVSELIF